jgi:hypothetical protein
LEFTYKVTRSKTTFGRDVILIFECPDASQYTHIRNDKVTQQSRDVSMSYIAYAMAMAFSYGLAFRHRGDEVVGRKCRPLMI